MVVASMPEKQRESSLKDMSAASPRTGGQDMVVDELVRPPPTPPVVTRAAGNEEEDGSMEMPAIPGKLSTLKGDTLGGLLGKLISALLS